MSWGRSGVTLQFALALIARGFCAARRELSLARRRGQAPRLLGPVSEISSLAKNAGFTPDLPDLGAERPTLRVTERVPQREQGGREIAHDELGFIADFYAPGIRLIVEVDGGYHARRVTADARRDRKLTRAGYRIVRVQAELVRRELPAAVFAVRRALTEP